MPWMEAGPLPLVGLGGLATLRGRPPASLTHFQTSFCALLPRRLRRAGVRAKWALVQRVRSAGERPLCPPEAKEVA